MCGGFGCQAVSLINGIKLDLDKLWAPNGYNTSDPRYKCFIERLNNGNAVWKKLLEQVMKDKW